MSYFSRFNMQKDSIYRQTLKNGKHRTRLANISGITIGMAVLIVMYFFVPKPTRNEDFSFITTALQSIGVIAALLSALAYNLKQQNISYYTKSLKLGYELHSPIKTSRILTNLVTLSFFTSAILIFSSCFIKINWGLSIIFISISTGLVSLCAIHYIYAIFAQEKLEEEFIKIINKDFIDSVNKGTSKYHKL